MSEPTTYAAVTHGALTHGSTTYYAVNSTGGTVATVEEEAVETHDNIWSARELNILGGFLWLAVIITLVGNLSCFYAVWKNLKKILEHPFFQSNVFCVLLSVVDVLLVLLVGIPAAVFFTAESEWLGNSFYNLAMVEAILDYLVWLQLLLVVAICLDRAGHICRPLTYTFSIKARKTTAACLFCVTIPFLLLTVPYIIVLNKSMAIAAETVSSLDDRDMARSFIERSTFKCKSYAYNNGTDADINIFMSCTVMTPPKDKWEGGKHFLKWENVAHPMVLLAAILSLLVSNGLIIRKLVESAAFQKDNAKRQEEVAKSIRMSSIVSTLQAVTLLVCTLPMRVAQMEKRFEIWEECDTSIKDNDCVFNATKYSHHYIMITKVLVFLGPMVNPWLYPIRMASIRSFLATKKRSVVSSAVRRFTVTSRTRSSEYRSKHHKTEYVTLETEDRRNHGEPQSVDGKSKEYGRV